MIKGRRTFRRGKVGREREGGRSMMGKKSLNISALQGEGKTFERGKG